MTAVPLLIIGGRLIDPGQGIDKVGDMLIADGKIIWMGELGAAPPVEPGGILRASGMVVSPGFIDLHCHLREPGFEEKETIATGTRAAARGGFTTVCCMPNTSPPMDSRATVEYVKGKARAEGVVHVLPIGCITRGRQGEELAEMGELAEAGVIAFSDDGDPVRSSGIMRQALEHGRSLGLPIIDHCQDTELGRDGVMNEGRVSARLGLRGMPAAAEESMVARDIALAQLTGARLHIAHVSAAGSVDLIRRAKKQGVPVTAEVTPHHLALTEDRVIGGGAGLTSSRLLPFACDTNAKVNPPLRADGDRQALIRGLKEGVIDAIATDHAPHTRADKLGEFDVAAFGISGLETALGSAMALVHGEGLGLVTLISKLAFEPAKIIGAGKGLGRLEVGAVADITIFDPEAEWLVDPEAFASKGKNTPLAGYALRGRVMATIVAGRLVHKDDSLRIEGAATYKAGTGVRGE